MKKYGKIFMNGIIDENPTFRMVLGMCPTLAITTAASNGIGMGLAVTFVLIFSNLVISLLAKTEYGVPRTVARVNNPKSEWLFDETWGVDVAVSTPRFMTALVEEAVSVGSLVSIFHFHQSGASMHELTLPEDSPVIGELVTDIELPPHTVLAAILRDYRPITPDRDERFERGDELIFLTAREGESSLKELPLIFT